MDMFKRLMTSVHHALDFIRDRRGLYRDLHKHVGLWRILFMEGWVTTEERSMLQDCVKRLPAGGKLVLQIGFNAGHSACAFLEADPDVEVVSVDIGNHSYSLRANQFIAQRFPGRHQLLMGDSREVLPWLTQHGFGPFDLIFIDGGHALEIAEADLSNTRKLATLGHTVVIMDDMVAGVAWGDGPMEAWANARDAGDVAEESFFSSHDGKKACAIGTFA
jgi:predicted O-methyltransferase YrrM